MHVDEVIEKFSSYHPITREDEEAFNIAIDCMKFTRDFLPLNATPERMKNALELLNLLEYAKIQVLKNMNKYYQVSDGWVTYYVNKETGDKKFRLDKDDVLVESNLDDFSR